MQQFYYQHLNLLQFAYHSFLEFLWAALELIVVFVLLLNVSVRLKLADVMTSCYQNIVRMCKKKKIVLLSKIWKRINFAKMFVAVRNGVAVFHMKFLSRPCHERKSKGVQFILSFLTCFRLSVLWIKYNIVLYRKDIQNIFISALMFSMFHSILP